jgi:hypothetical protein
LARLGGAPPGSAVAAALEPWSRHAGPELTAKVLAAAQDELSSLRAPMTAAHDAAAAEVERDFGKRVEDLSREFPPSGRPNGDMFARASALESEIARYELYGSGVSRLRARVARMKLAASGARVMQVQQSMNQPASR